MPPAWSRDLVGCVPHASPATGQTSGQLTSVPFSSACASFPHPPPCAWSTAARTQLPGLPSGPGVRSSLEVILQSCTSTEDASRPSSSSSCKIYWDINAVLGKPWSSVRAPTAHGPVPAHSPRPQPHPSGPSPAAFLPRVLLLPLRFWLFLLCISKRSIVAISPQP